MYSVDILIGAEVFALVLQNSRRVGAKSEPDTFNTIFGWVLLGSVSSHAPRPLHSFLTLDSTLDAFISRFWELEEVLDILSCSEEDRQCEELFIRTIHRDLSNRFVVSYPFAKDNLCFIDSRQIARNRFCTLERRFRSNPEFKIDYHKFMQDYLDSGIWN